MNRFARNAARTLLRGVIGVTIEFATLCVLLVVATLLAIAMTRVF